MARHDVACHCAERTRERDDRASPRAEAKQQRKKSQVVPAGPAIIVEEDPIMEQKAKGGPLSPSPRPSALLRAGVCDVVRMAERISRQISKWKHLSSDLTRC